MPYGNSCSRVLIAALAAAAVAAPAAMAKPIEPVGSVTAPHVAQDLRGEAASGTAAPAPTADLRGEGAKDQAPPVIATPRATVTSGSDDGVDGPIVGLIIAGTLALGGGLAVAAVRQGPRVAH